MYTMAPRRKPTLPPTKLPISRVQPRRSMVGTARIVGDIGDIFRELSEEAERSFQRTVRQLEDGAE